jgi:kanamycin nucleotidyltransferase
MPLEHAARLALAHTLTARFITRRRTVLAGLYGSTARNTDTPWSDLKLFFVVEDGEQTTSIDGLYCGTAVGAQVHTVGSLEHLIAHPDGRWPMMMAILSTLTVLEGDPGAIDHWLELARQVPADAFRASLARLAPALVFESCGRIQSCAARENRSDLGAAVLETLLEMGTALCLLNRSWAEHDYYAGLNDTMAFPLLPRDYALLAPALWHAADPAVAAALATRLLANYVVLLAEQGIDLLDWAQIPPRSGQSRWRRATATRSAPAMGPTGCGLAAPPALARALSSKLCARGMICEPTTVMPTGIGTWRRRHPRPGRACPRCAP